MVVCTNCGGEFPSRSKLFKHLPSCIEKKDAGDEGSDGSQGKDEEDCGVVEVVVREPGFYQVVVKPQGMPTMGGRTASGLSMQNHPALVIEEKRVTEQSHLWKVVRAVPVHRLDSATGGLLICAESAAAEQSLRCAFPKKAASRGRTCCSRNSATRSNTAVKAFVKLLMLRRSLSSSSKQWLTRHVKDKYVKSAASWFCAVGVGACHCGAGFISEPLCLY